MKQKIFILIIFFSLLIAVSKAEDSFYSISNNVVISNNFKVILSENVKSNILIDSGSIYFYTSNFLYSVDSINGSINYKINIKDINNFSISNNNIFIIKSFQVLTLNKTSGEIIYKNIYSSFLTNIYSYIASESDNTKVNKSGDNMSGNLSISNNYILNASGINLNSPFTPSGNRSYNFTYDLVGSVPSGWVEDITKGFFRVIGGQKVHLTHTSSNASSSNNYNMGVETSSDNNFTIKYNYSYETINNYNYMAFNNASLITTLSGIYLSVHSGNLYYYSSGWILIQSMTLNQTYEIKINNVKISTGKFDLYVDNVLKVNQGNFAGSSYISIIHLSGGGGENTDEYYDDFVITTGNDIPSLPYCIRVSYSGVLYSTLGVC